MQSGNIRITAIVIALALISVATYYRYTFTESAPASYQQAIPVIGEVESEHSHMSMIVWLDGSIIDFSQPQYQLQSAIVHFEDGNGTYIHKHAMGVTLITLFDTLGISITGSCFTLDTGEAFCTDDKRKLQVFINRKRFTGDLSRYELRLGDKILIDYSSDPELEIKLRMNAIPDLTDDL